MSTAQRLHPDAVAALAERATHVDTAQDRRLDRIESMVYDLHAGRTQHQQHVLRTLRALSFHIQVLGMQKIVLPAASVLAALFFGGFCAVMVLEHFK